MTLSLIDDLDEILAEDDHGIFYTHEGIEYQGIFNKEFYEQDVGTAGIASSEPVLYASSRDSSDIEIDDNINIASKTYTVVHKEPDNQGLIRITLNG